MRDDSSHELCKKLRNCAEKTAPQGLLRIETGYFLVSSITRHLSVERTFLADFCPRQGRDEMGARGSRYLGEVARALMDELNVATLKNG